MLCKLITTIKNYFNNFINSCSIAFLKTFTLRINPNEDKYFNQKIQFLYFICRIGNKLNLKVSAGFNYFVFQSLREEKVLYILKHPILKEVVDNTNQNELNFNEVGSLMLWVANKYPTEFENILIHFKHTLNSNDMEKVCSYIMSDLAYYAKNMKFLNIIVKTCGDNKSIFKFEDYHVIFDAILSGNKITFDFLLRHINFNDDNSDIGFRLFGFHLAYNLAISRYNIRMCEKLLCHGAIPEMPCPKYSTYFYFSKKKLKLLEKTVYRHQKLLLLYCLDFHKLYFIL